MIIHLNQDSDLGVFNGLVYYQYTQIPNPL